MKESNLLDAIVELDFNYNNGSIYFEGDLVDGVSCELSYDSSRENYIMIWDEVKEEAIEIDGVLKERIVNVLGEKMEEKKRELDEADADAENEYLDRVILNNWLYE